MCSTRASAGQSVLGSCSGFSAASNIRALPSQLRKVPGFSATAATGSTTSARSVTAPGRSSSETRKPTSSSASMRAGRVGQVLGVDPGDQQRRPAHRWPLPPRSGRCRGRSGREVRRRPRRTPPPPWPAGRSRDGRRAAATGARPPPRAPRSPARRGIHTSAAPVAVAVRRAAVSPPGHRGEPLAHHDHGAFAAQRLGGDGSVTLQADAARERVQPLGLGAGSGGEQGAARLLQAPAGVRGERERPLPVLAVGLAEPQEDAGRLLLGLEAGQQDRRRLLQRGVGDAAAVQVAAAPGHPRGEEVGLLAAVDAGPEVDVVGAEGDPRELAVRVGVLDGQPAAGEHAGPAACGRESGAPRLPAPPASSPAPAHPSALRTSGVVSRSRCWA